MLFGKRPRRVNRILIVEDEPLVAFDNEHFLRDAGYEVVDTVDTVAQAVAGIDKGVDLVLADVNLSDGNGRDVAAAAYARGVPLMFVTGGACPADAQAHAIGCLAKPYTQRDLLAAIEAVDQKLAGETPKRVPRGFTLFGS